MIDSIDTTIATPDVKTARADVRSTDGFSHQGLPFLVTGEQEPEQEPSGSLGNTSTVSNPPPHHSHGEYRNSAYYQHIRAKRMMAEKEASLDQVIAIIDPDNLALIGQLEYQKLIVRSSLRYCGDHPIPSHGKRKDGTRYDTGAPGNVQIHHDFDKHLSHYMYNRRCGNVWGCLGCATAILKNTRENLELTFDYLQAQGDKMYSFVTLTIPHKKDDKLNDIMPLFGKSVGALRSGSAWTKFKKRYGLVHIIRATEVTYSDAFGSHPHYHLLMVYDKSNFTQDDIDSIELFITNRWHNICKKIGLVSDDKINAHLHHGVKVETSANPVDWGYLSKIKKWEMASTTSKTARKVGGMSYWDVFELAANGDAKYKAVWFEYIEAMRGRAAVRFSPGLKKLVGIDDAKDEDIACEEPSSHVFDVPREGFGKIVRHKARVKVLETTELALAGGCCDEFERVCNVYGLIYVVI